jgi:glycosyltransferase involved in cell wall biosynthesis
VHGAVSWPYEIVIPTRNRPKKLEQCLIAIRKEGPAGARAPILVADSSTELELRRSTESFSAAFGARYVFHGRDGMSAARNACTTHAKGDTLINIDDDVYVCPGAIASLLAVSGEQTAAPAVIAARVRFGSKWSSAGKTGWTGYGRPIRGHEQPDYLTGAVLAYPRSLAERLPWNERLRSSDDVYMGTVWSYHGVRLILDAGAEAHHDEDLNRYQGAHYRYHIYRNLTDAIFLRRSPFRVVAYEVVGLLLALRGDGLSGWLTCLVAWLRGNRDFLSDFATLRRKWFFSPSLYRGSAPLVHAAGNPTMGRDS